jgi:hypothetical protein
MTGVDGALFQATLERCRRALLSDPELTAGAVRVAFVMLEFSNRSRFADTGFLHSWLAEATIARLACMSPAGVRKARGKLREAGVYIVEGGGKGPGSPTRCSLDPAWLTRAEQKMQASGVGEVWERGSDASEKSPASSSIKSPASSSLSSPQSAKEILQSEKSPASSSIKSPARDTYPPDTPSRTTLLKDDRARDAIDDDFDQWWRQFPPKHRHEGSRKAIAAKYRKALKSGDITAEELLAATMAYGMSRDVVRGYPCAPGTWLDQQRWRSTPHQHDGPGNHQTNRPTSAIDAAMRLAARLPDDEGDSANAR